MRMDDKRPGAIRGQFNSGEPRTHAGLKAPQCIISFSVLLEAPMLVQTLDAGVHTQLQKSLAD
jgi:hypothetical protein